MSDDARSFIERLYCQPGESTLDEVFKRVAASVGGGEDDALVYNLLSNGSIAFSTPIMMNARPDRKYRSAACFVLPIEDNLFHGPNSIMDFCRLSAEIYSFAGGIGANLSKLRAAGTKLSGGGVAGGPVKFMRMFQAVGEAIHSGGRSRGAAALYGLSARHPDILDFINFKRTNHAPNMNLSVYFHRQSDMTNHEVLNAMAGSAWATGCPGALFGFNMDDDDELHRLLGSSFVNACGEVVHPIGETGVACVLASINLSHVNGTDVVVPGKDLECVSRLLTRCLNRVVDRSVWPGEVGRVMEEYRPIGIGVTGFARHLLHRRIPYASERARSRLANILGGIMRGAKLESNGRNSRLMSLAPTGTTSFLMGVPNSTGIEPLYSLKYKKRLSDGTEIEMVEESVKDLDPKLELPDWAATAMQISPEDHLLMQAAAQSVVDMGVSKTINMPNGATVEDIKKVFLRAAELGLKGVTIYRDGSNPEQPIVEEKAGNGVAVVKVAAATEKRKGETGSDPLGPRKNRKTVSDARKYEIETPQGRLFVVFSPPGPELKEVFIVCDKPGSDNMAWVSALGRAVSIALQSGADPERIAYSLVGIGSSRIYMKKLDGKKFKVLSAPDAIGKLMLRELMSGESEVRKSSSKACPECKTEESFYRAGGTCGVCVSCGYSKCG